MLTVLTVLIKATELKEIKVLTLGEPGFCDAAVPPLWVGTASSGVLKALAVLTMALAVALALALPLSNSQGG